jgi:hypothetical protein
MSRLRSRSTLPHAARSALALAALGLLAACGGGGDAAPPEPGTPLACLALPAEVSWHADTTLASEWKDVLVDWRNRLWLAGYERGRLGESTVDPGGDARGVVQLLSNTGERLFDSGTRLDSPGADVAEALAIDDGGRVVVAGRSTGVLAGSANRGQFDLFVARLDALAPAAAWQLVQTGDERPQRPRRIRHLDATTLVIAGLDDDHVPTNYVAEWSDTTASRVDIGAGGALLPGWQHRSDSPEPDVGAALTVRQGEVFIGGGVLSGAQRGAFVRKLSRSGEVLWTARYTALPTDQVAALVALPDGSVLMAGTVFGSFRGGVHQGQQDVFVARIRADDGAVLWSAQLGSAGAEWLTDAKVDAQGRIWLYGETDGSVVAGRAPAGGADLFLMRVGPDGTLQRAWQWGTDDDEHATGLALDSCGRAVAVGGSGDNRRRRALLWFPQGQ